MTPQVSVFIPTLDAGPEFPAVLSAVLDQEIDGELDVVVADSGSRDGTLEFLRAQPVRVVEIPRGQFNHGLTRNLAVTESTGSLIAFLTQDALPLDRHWLRHLIDCFDDPRVAGAYSAQAPRSDANPFIRHRLSRWAAAQKSRRIQEVDSPETLAELPPLERLSLAAFDNVSSCIRRRIALELPFRRRSFGEDLDWGLRAIRAGHRLIFEPRSRVIHSHDRSMWYEFKRVYRDHQNLHELLDICTVPRWQDVWRCTKAAMPELLEAVREDPRLGTCGRLRWRLQSLPFSFTQNLAQHLGARSVRSLERSSPGFRIIDRLLGAGV